MNTMQEVIEATRSGSCVLIGGFEWNNKVVLVLSSGVLLNAVQIEDSDLLDIVRNYETDVSEEFEWAETVISLYTLRTAPTRDFIAAYTNIVEEEKLSVRQGLVYSDNYYGLTNVTDSFINKLLVKKPNTSILFSDAMLRKRNAFSRSYYTSMLSDMVVGKEKCLLVVGEAVFSALFESANTVIDVCIYGVDENEAYKVLERLAKRSIYSHIVRTVDHVIFLNDCTTIRVSLQLYKTVSEILHSFDVDSSCVGYDGKYWMTNRAKFCIEHGTNVLHSTEEDYINKLAIYAVKGMSVYAKDSTIQLTEKYAKLNDEVDPIRDRVKNGIRIDEVHSKLAYKDSLYKGANLIVDDITSGCRTVTFFCGAPYNYDSVIDVGIDVIEVIGSYCEENDVTVTCELPLKLTWKKSEG